MPVTGDLDLSLFQPAGPMLIGARRLLDRTETKLALPTARLGEVLSDVAPDYAIMLAGDAPVASYRTLYLDSGDQRSLEDHHRGRRPRFKVRVRHYPERELTFLEVKEKTAAERTRKDRVQRAQMDDPLSSTEQEYVAERCPLPVGQLQPAILSTFRRISLVGIEHPERVTIDLDLSFEREGRRSDVEGAVIIEVKQARFQARSPVFLALRRAEARRVTFSKYCAGASLLTDYRRRKQFLVQLGRLRRIADA